MSTRGRRLLFVVALGLPGCFLTLDEAALTRADGDARDAAAFEAGGDAPVADAAESGDTAAPIDAGLDLATVDAPSFDAAADLTTPADAVSPIDGADAAADLAIPVDATAPPDLAAPIDAAPPDLAVPVCTVALCDDFESGTLDPPWADYTSSATDTIDTVHAYRGRRAMHFALTGTSGNSGAEALIGEGQFPAGGEADVYTRVFFYLPSGSPAPSVNLILMTLFENVAPYDGINLLADHGKLAIDNQVMGAYHASSTVLPLGRWVCLEWHVHQALAGGGRYDLWLDGQAVAALALAGDTTQPANSPYNGFHLTAGIPYTTSPTPALDVWVDSVALDTQRIGCLK